MNRFGIFLSALSWRQAALALLVASNAALVDQALATTPSGNASLVITVHAALARNCQVSADSAATLAPLVGTWQPIALPSVTCNYRGTPTVRIWSRNAGILEPESGQAQSGQGQSGLAYELRLGNTILGRPGRVGAPVQTTLPLLDPHQITQAAIAIRLSMPDPALPTLPAGDFADMITMEVSP